MRNTSLMAWTEISPKLGEKQKIVYGIIEKHQPITDKNIANILGWSINCVTPRRGELEKLGLVISNGLTRDEKTKRLMHWWIIKK